MDAVASRVKRVGAGWESQLSIAADGLISRITMFELCEAFYSLPRYAPCRHAGPRRPPRQRRTQSAPARPPPSVGRARGCGCAPK